MVNVRTLRGLHAALVDCVPGKAQRARLLAALARVPGNRHVSAVTAWLCAREDEAGGTQRERREVPPPPKSGVFRARLVTYTQAASEVNVTMTRGTAEELLKALEDLADPLCHTDVATGQLYRALRTALEGERKRG